MTQPERQRERRPAGRLVADLALGLGLLVAATTAATQTRRTGRFVADLFGGDLLDVACSGFAAAVVALVARAVVPRRDRGRCLVGLVLSLTPVALLAYHLTTTAG